MMWNMWKSASIFLTTVVMFFKLALRRVQIIGEMAVKAEQTWKYHVGTIDPGSTWPKQISMTIPGAKGPEDLGMEMMMTEQSYHQLHQFFEN
jgi:hypothetical protein